VRECIYIYICICESVSNGIDRGGGCVEREQQGVEEFLKRKTTEQRVFLLVMGSPDRLTCGRVPG